MKFEIKGHFVFKQMVSKDNWINHEDNKYKTLE